MEKGRILKLDEQPLISPSIGKNTPSLRHNGGFPCRKARPDMRNLSTLQEQAVLDFVERKPGQFQDQIVDFVDRQFDIKVVSRILTRNNFTRKRGTRV